MSIRYRREGRGPTVLLIHGVGGDATNWSTIATRLATRFDVISIDLRGHGSSEPINAPVTAHDFARDAVGVLDAAGIETCRVVGFSLGGTVALALTLDFPARIERLVVIGTPCGRTPDEAARGRERIVYLEQNGVAALAEGNRERWFTDAFREAHPDIVDARVAQVANSDPRSYRHAFAVFCTADFADRLHEIAIPALVITGEHDVAATPRMARLMAERIRVSQLEVLPRLRHSLLIEAPLKVAALLDAFL